LTVSSLTCVVGVTTVGPLARLSLTIVTNAALVAAGLLAGRSRSARSN